MDAASQEEKWKTNFTCLRSADSNLRLQALHKLQSTVERGKHDLTAKELEEFVRTLLQMLQEGNTQSSAPILNCLDVLVHKYGNTNGSLWSSVLASLKTFLFDSKSALRDHVQHLALAIVKHLGVVQAFATLNSELHSKAWRVRDQTLRFLVEALKDPDCVLGDVADLLRQVSGKVDDPVMPVRQAAIEAVESIKRLTSESREEPKASKTEAASHAQLNSQSASRQPDQLNEHASGIITAHKGTPSGNTGRVNLASSNSPMARARPSSYRALEEAGDPVSPISVYSDRELMSHMEDIERDLKELDDWKARTGALERLQGLSMGGAAHFKEFISQLRDLQELISAQISDLRSSVCKTACKTVALLAKHIGDGFGPLAELWLPALLKLVYMSTSVMANSADMCIRIIIASTELGFSKNIFPLLFETYKAKRKGGKGVLRCRCVEYVMSSVALWSDSGVEVGDSRFRVPMQEFITLGISDPDSSTRAAARQLLWVVHARAKDYAQGIIDSLDAQTQKHVYTERKNVSINVFKSDEGPAMVDDCPTPTVVNTNSSKQTSGDTNSSMGTSCARRVLMPVTTTASPNSPNNGTTIPVQQQRALFGSTSKTPFDVSDNFAAPADENINFSNRQQISNPAVRQISQQRRMSIGPAARVASNPKMFHHRADAHTFTHTETLPVLEEQDDLTIANEDALTQPLRGSTSSSYRRQSLAVTGRFQGPQRVAVAESKIAQSIHSPTVPSQKPVRTFKPDGNTHKQTNVRSSTLHHSNNNTTVQEILRMCADPHWATRVNGLQLMAKVLEDTSEIDMSFGLPLFDKLIDALVVQLSDVNNSIVQAAFQALETILCSQSERTAGKVSSILPKLLLKLGDTKPRIREAASSLLDLLRKTYDPNLLVSTVFPRMHEFPDKVKLATCDFLQVMLPYTSSYFSVPAQTRACLMRALAILSPNSSATSSRAAPPLYKAVEKLIEGLYNLQPDVVTSQIPTLSIEHQDILKHLMGRKIRLSLLPATTAPLEPAPNVEFEDTDSHHASPVSQSPHTPTPNPTPTRYDNLPHTPMANGECSPNPRPPLETPVSPVSSPSMQAEPNRKPSVTRCVNLPGPTVQKPTDVLTSHSRDPTQSRTLHVPLSHRSGPIASPAQVGPQPQLLGNAKLSGDALTSAEKELLELVRLTSGSLPSAHAYIQPFCSFFAALARDSSQQFWEHNKSPMVVLLDVLKIFSEPVQEQAENRYSYVCALLDALHCLCKHQTDFCEGFGDIILQRLISMMRLSCQTSVTLEVFATFVQRSPTTTFLHLVSGLRSNSLPLHECLVGLHLAIQYVPTDILIKAFAEEDHHEALGDLLAKALRDAQTCVRKATAQVWALSYIRAGEAMVPFMARLSVVQRKLVVIYIDKLRQTHTCIT